MIEKRLAILRVNLFGANELLKRHHLGERLNFRGRELAVIKPDVLHAAFTQWCGAALADFGRGGGDDAALQRSGIRLHRCVHAIHKDAESAGLALAVIGHKEVLPDACTKRRFGGGHFQSVAGPLTDDVDTQFVGGLHDVPATEAVLLIHAGEDAATLRHIASAEPQAIAEGLVLLEIPHIAEVKIAARFDLRCRPQFAIGFPGDGTCRLEGLRGLCLATGGSDLLALAFIQRDVGNDALRRNVSG